jgi:hypothetical protein
VRHKSKIAEKIIQTGKQIADHQYHQVQRQQMAQPPKKQMAQPPKKQMAQPLLTKQQIGRTPQITCRVCGDMMGSDDKFEHLITSHLKRSLYKCPSCPFSSAIKWQAVSDHIQAHHPGNEWEPIDCIAQFSTVIESWSDRCYPRK